MPKCQISSEGPVYDDPPIQIRQQMGDVVFQYFKANHLRLYGQGNTPGDLDSINVATSFSDGLKDHGNSTNVTAYQHHGSGLHSSLIQASSLSDTAVSVVAGVESSVSVTNPNADLTYDQPEVDLVNEMKADINSLVNNFNALVVQFNLLRDDHNVLVADYNTLKANLRSASLLAV